MMKFGDNRYAAIVVATVLTVLAQRVEYVAAQALPGWDMIFDDEFNGTTLNTADWVPLDRVNSNNNEKQDYIPSQVSVSGGNLVLTAENVPSRGKQYKSGLITSKIPYGIGQPSTGYTKLRFEARIDLPTSKGMWPAFWLNPNELIGWPKGGEIDIMENKGSQPNRTSSAYHYQISQTAPCCNQHEYVFANNDYSGPASGNFHNTFHTYAVEWDATSLRFYADGVNYQTRFESPDLPIYEQAKYIILNLAIGGDFDGDPNGSTIWPEQMLVDYVRVWAQPATAPEPASAVLMLIGVPWVSACGRSRRASKA